MVELPFRPLTVPFYDDLAASTSEKGDPYYEHKRKYTSVDVMVTNVLVRPNIVLMNPDMIKEMISAQNLFMTKKEKGVFEVMFSIIDKGLISI